MPARCTWVVLRVPAAPCCVMQEEEGGSGTIPTQQFELLEESGPGTQLIPSVQAVSGQTLMVVK